MPTQPPSAKADSHFSCFGHCPTCGTTHNLPDNPAIQPCLDLMKTLKNKKRIDLLSSDNNANPLLSTDYLYGPARGQMFGVMVCRHQDGSMGTFRAFSGQYNGIWHVDGWTPPLVAEKKFHNINHDVEKEIKELGRRINALDHSLEQQILKRTRKSLSQKLMKDIHALYQMTNFHGQTRSLQATFTGPGGIPTGTGDCCAPKLLNYAATHGLQPLGLAEFYWGKANKSGTRQHGSFYPSCKAKCQPILGFMLCGLHNVP